MGPMAGVAHVQAGPHQVAQLEQPHPQAVAAPGTVDTTAHGQVVQDAVAVEDEGRSARRSASATLDLMSRQDIQQRTCV